MFHSIDVQVNHSQTYSIQVGMDIWDDALHYFSANWSNRKVFIVADEKVYGLHGQRIEHECSRYFNSLHLIQIPEGEKSKSVQQWERLQNNLLNNGVERTTPLLAIGGGVTGDLAGFAAATVLRGIPLIHMPTSLLAMVDSSIGGKTGINHGTGKNLIGAFFQPDTVFSDVLFLETLSRREWIGGLAEMIKYAAIQDPDLFDELDRAVQEGFQPTERWMKLVGRCAAIKAEIVQQDVRESGKRAWLNFGHTFGHALEKFSGYGEISHGEAVYVGMLAALYYSKGCGAPVDKARFSPFHSLYSVNLPSEDCIPDLIKAMQHDKKVKEETIRLVLLNNWGEPYIDKCKDESLLEEAWHEAFGIMNSRK